MAAAGAPVTVRTPGTSANLGPGFDAFGLAVDLYDEVTAQLTDAGLGVEATGEGADEVPLDESHLVVRAMRHTFDHLGVEPSGLSLRCTNVLPHGRGLGSSASAIVSGVRAAEALAVAELGAQALSDESALRLATDLEGHPDNVAPALFGGLTVSWTEPDGPRTARVQVHDAVVPVAFVPPEPVSTAVARGLLPAQVDHAVAAANSARAGLLVLGLTQDPSLLLAGTFDRLHQPYREPAMPDSMRLVEQLRDQAVAAVISGAGPTVMAFGVQGAGGAAGDLDALRSSCPAGWTCHELHVDQRGAAVVRGES